MRKFLWLIALVVCCGAWGFGQSLEIVAPNGGERLVKGTSIAINWQATNVAGTVSLVLMKNHESLGVIAAGLNPQAGSYRWTVGEYHGGSAPPGSGYRISIQTEQGADGVADLSDSGFSIAASQPDCESQPGEQGGLE